ncbi:hypothetical protein MUK42_34668 [Musa troglodytarum]|uniref:Uncharacterized protein n=1 Tax=Musa troglodytarum TaxID=320322 RepID=A0A9E7KRM5_9LILI|nr:hypothetical protein MUK42_34668 [Musa troglodytarum]
MYKALRNLTISCHVPMAGEGGARNLDVKRVLKEGQSFAKRMEAVVGVNILAAQRVQKGALITALPTVVANVAVMKVAAVLQEVNQVYASSMEVARGA